MTFPNYQGFLEEIVYQLKDEIKGQIELRHNDYKDLMCRYDIVVKFNCNLTICVSCNLSSDLGIEISKLYYSYKYEPEMAEYIVHVGTMQVFEFIKKAIFDYFFKIT